MTVNRPPSALSAYIYNRLRNEPVGYTGDWKLTVRVLIKIVNLVVGVNAKPIHYLTHVVYLGGHDLWVACEEFERLHL